MADDLQLTAPTAKGIASYPPGATYGPRLMRDYEFVWMIEGDAEYCREGQTVAAPAGSIVLCQPGATDFFRWDPQRPTRHAFYHFDVMHVPDSWRAPDTWPLV
ncbi:MAG TPA: hypothetical protein VL282_10980, partial [Tepidisphaeraceae bacterium]|nr:hypothetical protein [Tepidisphaeraceae bacterium]